MSKFAKDVLDTSSYLFAIAKNFSDYVETSIASRIASFGQREKAAIAEDYPDAKRAALREDMFI